MSECYWCGGDGYFIEPETLTSEECAGCRGTGRGHEELTDEEWAALQPILCPE